MSSRQGADNDRLQTPSSSTHRHEHGSAGRSPTTHKSHKSDSHKSEKHKKKSKKKKKHKAKRPRSPRSLSPSPSRLDSAHSYPKAAKDSSKSRPYSASRRSRSPTQRHRDRTASPSSREYSSSRRDSYRRDSDRARHRDVRRSRSPVRPIAAASYRSHSSASSQPPLPTSTREYGPDRPPAANDRRTSDSNGHSKSHSNGHSKSHNNGHVQSSHGNGHSTGLSLSNGRALPSPDKHHVKVVRRVKPSGKPISIPTQVSAPCLPLPHYCLSLSHTHTLSLPLVLTRSAIARADPIHSLSPSLSSRSSRSRRSRRSRWLLLVSPQDPSPPTLSRKPPRQHYKSCWMASWMAWTSMLRRWLRLITLKERVLNARYASTCLQLLVAPYHHCHVQERSATQVCDQCEDEYCAACFTSLHRRGKRADHTWVPKSPVVLRRVQTGGLNDLAAAVEEPEVRKVLQSLNWLQDAGIMLQALNPPFRQVPALDNLALLKLKRNSPEVTRAAVHGSARHSSPQGYSGS